MKIPRALTAATLALLLLFSLHCTSAAAYVYEVDFDTGPDGWSAYNLAWQANGGVGDSGYLQGSRYGYLPTFYPEAPDACAKACGDLEAVFGNRIRFSYYINILQDSQQAATHALIDSTYAGLGTGGYWQLTTIPDPSVVTDWTLVTFDIDTDWTDAEAQANGWVKRGALSFSDTLADFNSNYFYYGSGVVSGNNLTGIDSVRIESIPEPGTFGLLALGVAALLGKRREA